MPNRLKTAVLVAGSWGTAIASVLADNGHEVVLWTRNEKQAGEINATHRNSKFLSEATLPEAIRATTSMEDALRGAHAVIVVAPSSAMREVAAAMKPCLAQDTLLIHATKGFESGTLKRMSEVLSEELPDYPAERIVVLSGPSHAEEVIQQSPTTVVVASASLEAAEEAQDLLINSYFRVYTNNDVVGVEMGGALKNIIALGAGLCDGLGFGDNARAALLTRGLTEMTRLGTAMGGVPATFSGLAGIGDLIVTCTSKHSRNWRAGSLLAQGLSLDEVLSRMGMVVEGVRTTQAAYVLARQFEISMPITTELHKVLFEGKDPQSAVDDLMERNRKHEMPEVLEAAETLQADGQAG